MSYKLKLLLLALLPVVVTAAVAACTYSAAMPSPVVTVVGVRNPHLGGPWFRVFDADEIDSIDERLNLAALFMVAEECTGIEGDFDEVRVFSASRIIIKNKDGSWRDDILGMWAWQTGWVYLLTGGTPTETAFVLVHEYVHYLTKLGHPEADAAIETCMVFMGATPTREREVR